MTLQEIHKESFKLEWKVDDCHVGPECWCKVIKLKEPLVDDEHGEEHEVIGSGAIGEDQANHIVQLHNKSLQNVEED